jgi:predicted site-specific integrase-resolvase
MEQQYLNRREAAAVCGVDADTLRRDQRNGRLPNTRQHNGRTEYLITDLVAAGRLDPIAASGDVGGAAHRALVERDLDEARREIAVLSERLAGKCERIADLEAQVAFLRGIAGKAVA